MAHNRDKPQWSKYDDSDDDDDTVTFFLPSEDIDFDVLASDLKCYLGNNARVEIGNHHRVSTAYHFRHTIWKRY